jgi:hypothetical protein
MLMALGPMSIQVVRLKRDLRLYDHRPLLNALRSGPTLLIYAGGGLKGWRFLINEVPQFAVIRGLQKHRAQRPGRYEPFRLRVRT